MPTDRSWLRAAFDFITFHHMPIRRKFTLFTFGVSFWYFVIAIVGAVRQPDWRGVGAIVVSLLVAHALLVAFAWNATRSMTIPIHAINSQVREITSGELTDLEHIDVSTDDEVGELTTRFNGLLDALRELNTFKKVIEHDETAENVYERLKHIFSAKGLPDHHLLVLDGERRGMRRLFAEDGAACSCAEALADGAMHCRSFKTASAVSSESFPGICRLFLDEGRDHQCIPLIIGGTAGGVVQFVYGGASGPSRIETRSRVEVAKRFLHEALPVLEARRLTDTLRESAVRDGLTKVFNRRYLEESHGPMAALVKRRGSKMGVVMCDVDHFKRVNDQHGHASGDQVLKDVAATLGAAVRASDVVVRYGGEEFLLLLHDTDREGAALVAERARTALADREIAAGSAVLRATMSFGVAEFPADDKSFWEVVRLADEALYRAKAEGRNRVVQHGLRAELSKPPALAESAHES